MLAHSSASTVAATSTAAPPVSVRRKSRTGGARLRIQAVRPWKGAAGTVTVESVTAAQDNGGVRSATQGR